MAQQALLVMDVQPGILASLGEKKESYLERVRKLVDSAHVTKVPVIFVVVRFREGFPEVSSNNKSFSSIAKSAGDKFFETSELAQPTIKPEPRDIVVSKRRVSAFSGSDLEVVLRALKADELVLCGIATSGVVLSTVREAADKDYKLTVIADACFDSDEEVHTLLTTKIFSRQADVVNVSDWIKDKKK